MESLTKQKEIEKTQKELLFIMEEAIEARSKDTGHHVKRVALLCELLATKLGLEESFIEALRLAAPLHDLGKIVSLEHRLHKPDKLDSDEWKIMKTHTQIGGNTLKKQMISVPKLATRLAHYHNENWDGSGYPEGLKGENIPIEARIMAVVDVFDALGSKRCYKEPWSNDQIKDFMIVEKNKKFDAALIDIVIDNFDEFTSIRAQFPDS